MAKTFAIEDILGLTTGVLLKHQGFGDMHQLAEFVAGHPIWTHEFADKGTIAALRAAVIAQHPALASAEDFKPGDRPMTEYLPAYVARAAERFGKELAIEPGYGERKESPLQSLERLMP